MAYWQSKGLPRGGKKTQPNPYKWCKTTIQKILSQQEYCGDVINFKTCSKSFKNKTRFPNGKVGAESKNKGTPAKDFRMRTARTGTRNLYLSNPQVHENGQADRAVAEGTH